MNSYIHIVLVGILLMSTGCATIIKGQSEKVNFSSNPGAQVYIDGSFVGNTPVEMKLKSKKEYFIEFRQAGHKTKSYKLNNHLQGGWIVLDILLGLVPVIVDAATGAWYKLDDDEVNVTLDKI